MSPYLASSDEFGQEIFAIAVFVIFGAAWWPSHHFFTWLRKKHHSPEMLTLTIVGCLAASFLLVVLGLAVDSHVSPDLRSMGPRSGNDPIDINFMWAPFALF